MPFKENLLFFQNPITHLELYDKNIQLKNFKFGILNSIYSKLFLKQIIIKSHIFF